LQPYATSVHRHVLASDALHVPSAAPALVPFVSERF
jgi:hypothetical protein